MHCARSSSCLPNATPERVMISSHGGQVVVDVPHGSVLVFRSPDNIKRVAAPSAGHSAGKKRLPAT